jgi:hypothetical protein
MASFESLTGLTWSSLLILPLLGLVLYRSLYSASVVPQWVRGAPLSGVSDTVTPAAAAAAPKSISVESSSSAEIANVIAPDTGSNSSTAVLASSPVEEAPVPKSVNFHFTRGLTVDTLREAVTRAGRKCNSSKHSLLLMRDRCHFVVSPPAYPQVNATMRAASVFTQRSHPLIRLWRMPSSACRSCKREEWKRSTSQVER